LKEEVEEEEAQEVKEKKTGSEQEFVETQ